MRGTHANPSPVRSGIAPLDMPWMEGPRTLVRGRHRGAFAFFKDFVPAAVYLRSGRLDESKPSAAFLPDRLKRTVPIGEAGGTPQW